MNENSGLTKRNQNPQNINASNGMVASAPEPAPPLYARYDDTEVDEGGFSRLHDYLRSARKHLFLILGVVVFITMLSAVYMARQADIYEARSRVQVDLEIDNPALGNLKGASVVLGGRYQDPTYFNTQLQILTSAALLTRVIKTLNLQTDQAYLNP